MHFTKEVYKLAVSKNRTLIWIVFLVPEIEEKSSKVKHRPFGNKSTFEGGTKKNCYTVSSAALHTPVYMNLAQFICNTKIREDGRILSLVVHVLLRKRDILGVKDGQKSRWPEVQIARSPDGQKSR